MEQERCVPVIHILSQYSPKEDYAFCMVGLGVVYFELLPRNQIIDSNVYCRQL